MKRNYAFTLIELLVVIAIIAILAAILFPVFAQAKVAAKKTQSLSNTKNIGTGIMIYSGDVEDSFPQGEYGWGDTHVTWVAQVLPYIKSGDSRVSAAGVSRSFGNTGVFLSPGNPRTPPPNAGSHEGNYNYGVHHSLFVNNYDNPPGGAANPGVSQGIVESSAEKIMMLEKGVNNAGAGWNYPWFHDWQNMWVGPICTTVGDPSTVFRDGVDVYNRASTMYDPRFDSDCSAATAGSWECAAHPRYRFAETAPAVFVDTHAKAMKKGQIKWFQNIWIDRRNVNRVNWYYDYQNGGGWGFPGIR